MMIIIIMMMVMMMMMMAIMLLKWILGTGLDGDVDVSFVKCPQS